MIEPVDTVWLDGALRPTEASKVHLLSNTLHNGFGAFDGIRSYRQQDGGVALFRVAEHMQRLINSATAVSIETEYDAATLVAAASEVIRANDLQDAYVRPLVYVGEPNIIFAHWLNQVHVAVIVFPWSGYSDRSREQGTTATFARYPRPKALADLFKAKVCGHYLLSVAAYADAKQRGFGQAIFLDEDGMVCESTGENLFTVRDGILSTPPTTRSLLPGITRDTVMRLARELGHEVVERDLTKDDLLTADEVFTTGTASELLPIPEIDGHKIGTGTIGPVTVAVQGRFMDVVSGRVPDAHGWLTRV